MLLCCVIISNIYMFYIYSTSVVCTLYVYGPSGDPHFLLYDPCLFTIKLDHTRYLAFYWLSTWISSCVHWDDGHVESNLVEQMYLVNQQHLQTSHSSVTNNTHTDIRPQQQIEEFKVTQVWIISRVSVNICRSTDSTRMQKYYVHTQITC